MGLLRPSALADPQPPREPPGSGPRQPRIRAVAASTHGALRFAPGAIVAGAYRVERILSDGSASLVLEVSEDDGRRAAVKVLRVERRTPELEARFAREARIAAELTSRHVVPVLASGHTEKGDLFLAMELLAGRDLAAELAARGPLPLDEAVGLVLEACAGVAEAHAAGLVHRGLKPANLFVARGPGGSAVKVLDLGLTKVKGEKGQRDLAATACDFDTPQYMAPEQIRSARQVDARADQHALAAVLHELCAGEPPFTAPSFTQLAVEIAVAPPPHLRATRPEAPRSLDEAIRRALAKAPGDRFPDLLGFAEAISLAVAGDDRSRRALSAARAALGRNRVW